MQNPASHGSLLYHYTSIHHLPGILHLGYLKLTESNLRLDREMFRPVVWLTDSISVSGHGLEGSIADKHEIRIALNCKPDYQLWSAWSKDNRIDKAVARALSEGNNSSSWWISEKPIPCSEFLSIENTRTGEIYYRFNPLVANPNRVLDALRIRAMHESQSRAFEIDMPRIW